jgi:hypothetical protein
MRGSFAEKFKAFLTGRSDDDPSFSWYHDELGFFDHYYVIPLAKRLGECQVFGVSSERVPDVRVRKSTRVGYQKGARW